MIFYPDERVALFIDGANLYATAKTLGFDIDYKRLLSCFRKRSRLVRIRCSSTSPSPVSMQIWLSLLCTSMPTWSTAGLLLCGSRPRHWSVAPVRATTFQRRPAASSHRLRLRSGWPFLATVGHRWPPERESPGGANLPGLLVFPCRDTTSRTGLKTAANQIKKLYRSSR